MSKLKTTTYELRDVAIMQAPVSFCNHRGDVDNKVEICGRSVYPIFVAPMASVTDEKNYKVWLENGLTPVVPRSVQLSFEERMEIAKETFVSISLKEAKEDFIEYANKTICPKSSINYHVSDKRYICVDIAHGTLSELYDACRNIKELYGYNVEIMTGNVANLEDVYSFYANAGIDWVRAGIGGGCFTPDMCIKTENGVKKISEIKIGDKVLTHTGKYQNVTHLHKFKKNEKLYNINNIKCTENHLFYVVDKDKSKFITDENINDFAYWVKASELDNNKHFLIKR